MERIDFIHVKNVGKHGAERKLYEYSVRDTKDSSAKLAVAVAALFAVFALGYIAYKWATRKKNLYSLDKLVRVRSLAIIFSLKET